MYNLLTTQEQVRQAVDRYLKLDALSLDTETTDLHPKKGRIRLIQFDDGDQTDIVDLDRFPQPLAVFEALRPVLESGKIKKSIFNAKFEWQWFKYHADIDIQTIFDSYLVDMMVSNMTTGIMGVEHGLGAVVNRYLKEEMDKEEQKSDWSGVLSERQLEYAARDAKVLLPLRKTLLQKITQFELGKIAKLEFDAIPAFASIELYGYPINVKKLTKFHDIAKADAKTAYNTLQEAVRATRPKGGIQGALFADIDDKDFNAVNLNSHVQIKTAFKALGVPVFDPKTDKALIEQFKKKGKYFTISTAEKDITPLQHEYPVVKLLLDNRGATKLVTNIEQMLDNADKGRIYPSIFQIKAETGRTAMHDPNLQQAPGRSDFRECFEVRKGRKLTIADFSGIEMRVAAHNSQDPIMLKAYREGMDLHSVTHAALIGQTYEWVEEMRHSKDPVIKERMKRERVFAKTINFGVLFGMGKYSYSQRTGLTVDEADENIQKVRKTYPILMGHLDMKGNQALRSLMAVTLWGRGVRFYSPGNRASATNEAELNMIKAQEGAIKRNGKNHPIQGTAADIAKLAMGRAYRRLKPYRDTYIVHFVHDEIQAETSEKDAEAVRQTIHDCMVEVAEEVLTTIPMKVDAAICNSWAEKE